MQRMQKEVEEEGEKEKELYEKFVCYCTSSDASLSTTNQDATKRIDELSSKLKAESAEKTQFTQELGDHKKDREAAKADLEEATMLREKEAEEFAAMKADSDVNIAALSAAIPAIEKGMRGATLLQVPHCKNLKRIISASSMLDTGDQHDLLAFLEGGSSSDEGSPGTGEILGMLKQMAEEFEGNLQKAVDSENSALAGFAELKASKEKEIEIATESIESKMAQAGGLAVSISQTTDDLKESEAAVEDTEEALESLHKQCAAKEKEYSQATKDRADEVKALSAAISVLNEDDTLDESLLQKDVGTATVQERGTAFLQKSMTSNHASRAAKAQAILSNIVAQSPSLQLNLMLLSLKSNIRLSSTSGLHKFEKIVKMLDNMVILLGKEQDEDDKMKEWCRGELEKASDEEATAKTEVGRFETSVAEMADAMETLKDEIEGLQKQITDLDYTVAEATLQRKEEHNMFQQSLQMQEASIALLGKAKKKLEKVYKPALVQKPWAAPKAEDSVEQDVFSFVQVKSHAWSLEDAMDSSETDSDARQRAAKGGGVMALMDMIIHDTKMAMKDAENAEKEAVNDYAKVMSDAHTQRAQDSKAVTDKTAAMSELEAKSVKEKEGHTLAKRELLSIGKLIADLNGQCNFILQNYDLRKEARASESDSLVNAKAILSGMK